MRKADQKVCDNCKNDWCPGCGEVETRVRPYEPDAAQAKVRERARELLEVQYNERVLSLEHRLLESHDPHELIEIAKRLGEIRREASDAHEILTRGRLSR